MATANPNTGYTPRLKSLYREEARTALLESSNLKNVHQAPRIEKIVLNVGLGRVKEDKRAKELAINTLTKVSGQRPIETKARKSIAGFKLREGQTIGAKVTLRGDRMYEFLDRLINIVLPRVRDFRGLSQNGFDQAGNYNLGIEEQSVFPELSFEETSVLHGVQITIVISSSDHEKSLSLLKLLGMPFEKTSEEKETKGGK